MSRAGTDAPRRPRAGRPPSPATIREIVRRLASRYGPLEPPRRWDPLEELILTVLSQNTSDVNSDRAFAAMRARWPTWEGLAAADPGSLAAAIKPGGLSNIKAPRILAILAEIRARQDGSLDLEWMHRASDRRVEDYLTSLPGVGPKTAACVLAFSLGRPALPVDTHVLRVARRLGFLDARADATRAHEVLRDLVPARLRVRMHVGLIRLGRELCRAGMPRCAACPLADLCPTAPSVLGAAVSARRPPAARRPAAARPAAAGRPPASPRPRAVGRTSGRA
ncbi:MAG TPA: endonuclease III [Actinomycetota bacterium]